MPAHTPRLSEALQDRYRTERELGEGGMATVYLAQDLRHNRPVALFDSGEADGFLYYVMPYVEGETLQERLQETNR